MMEGHMREARRPPWGRGLAGRWALLVPLITALASIGAPEPGLGAGPAEIVRRAERTDRVIALTFDDGWSPARCERILDILLEHGVPATWFPNAVHVARAPALWRRIAAQHPIGNHTAHHRDLTRLRAREIRHEVASDERRIETVTGRPMSKLFRPPYGASDERARTIAAALGYETLLLWDVAADDAFGGATDRTVTRRASRGRPGSIVLLHCGPEVTPRVLPAIIARYACAGYRFATVEELLAGGPGVSAQAVCPKRPVRRGADGPHGVPRLHLLGCPGGWRGIVPNRLDGGMEPPG
jgi:peptidoglycan/xylan/chitin deacetylase (PgdA/CDA1 family)